MKPLPQSEIESILSSLVRDNANHEAAAAPLKWWTELLYAAPARLPFALARTLAPSARKIAAGIAAGQSEQDAADNA